MTKHNNETAQIIQRISNIRKQISTVNKTHYRIITEQLDNATNEMTEFLDAQRKYLNDYAQNLKDSEECDVSEAMLDNVMTQLKTIVNDFHETIEIPDTESVELDDINNTVSKSYKLLNCINRLHHIEIILHTHIGESHNVEN